MLTKTYTFLISSILIHFVHLAAAQSVTGYNQTNSALPASGIASVGIDNKGIKWISAGDKGLFTYDGQTFAPYKSPDVRGNFGEFFKDSKGNLWIPFTNKQHMLGRYDGSYWTVFTETAEPLLNDAVYKMAEDKRGNIYAGTNRGLITYDGKHWKKITLPKEDIYAYGIIALDVQGDHIAAGTASCLALYDGHSWKRFEETNSELRLGTVRAVKYAPDSSLYIGYGGGFGDGGFSILKNNKWKHYNKQNSKMPDHMVRTIRFSPKGVLWMATNNGVVKIDGDKWTTMKFNKGPWDAIMDITVEDDHTVWIVDIGGLVKYSE